MASARSAARRQDIEERRRQVVERLHKIEGQVRGIARMVEGERDCEALLTQVLAAKVALDRTAVQIAAGFVGDCLYEEAPRAKARVARVISLLSRTG